MKTNTHNPQPLPAGRQGTTHDRLPRILIVNVNWIGDVLFSTAFINTIKGAYPNSFIACMVPPRCREILELNPDLDEIIVYDEKGKHSSMAGKLRFISGLKKEKFDIAFLLHRSFTKALFVYIMGIKERIGYYTRKKSLLLTKAIKPLLGQVHRVDYFLNIAKAIGIHNCTRQYRFFIRDKDRSYIKGLLEAKGVKEDTLVIVINPGGNWWPKRWPKQSFAGLADRLIEEFNTKIIISGAEKDKKLGESIASFMKKEAINLCGKTDLKQLGALMESADLVISNDTGPMHIAVAMEASTIALFGPTHPSITGPCGKGKFSVIWKAKECAVPCYNLSCADNICMRLITVEDVISEARKMLVDKK